MSSGVELVAPVFNSNCFSFDDNNPRPPHYDLNPDQDTPCGPDEVKLFGIDMNGRRYPLATNVPIVAVAGLVRARIRRMHEAAPEVGHTDDIYEFDPAIGDYHQHFAGSRYAINR